MSFTLHPRGGTTVCLSRRPGFTLIEMLLVVAIISLLIAILLPALKVSKAWAQSSVCEANQRALLTGYQQYSKDNANQLMGANTRTTWDWLRSESNTATSITDGRLWPYVRSMSAYVCPNQVYPSYLNSYSINGMMNGEAAVSGATSKRHWTANMRPSEQMVFIEEDDGRGWNLNSFLIGGADGSYVDWVAANHAGGDNLGFLDGHIEYWEWRTPHLRKRPKPNPPAAPDPGSVDWARLRKVFRTW